VTSATRSRALAAEALGTALLLATVIGSGVMGERLSDGNIALALLGNTLATGAILTVLITVLGPISGAHFNPAVTLTEAIIGRISWQTARGYIAVQIAGALIGVWVAHIMFDLPVLQLATKLRSGSGQWVAEFVATFGLILTIIGCCVRAPAATAAAVGLYISAAYWFTASTSFANPAVTIARAASDTFAGIAPGNVLAFIVAQLAGALAALALARWLWQLSAPPAAD